MFTQTSHKKIVPKKFKYSFQYFCKRCIAYALNLDDDSRYAIQQYIFVLPDTDTLGIWILEVVDIQILYASIAIF